MHEANPATTAQPGSSWTSAARLAPPLALLALILFPFGWLGRLWPAFGRGLDTVFATDARHAVGHSSLFCLLGIAVLAAWPALRERPWRYLGLLFLAGIGQEFFQMLYKGRLLLFDDSRDLLTDLAGLLAAFVIVRYWENRSRSLSPRSGTARIRTAARRCCRGSRR